MDKKILDGIKIGFGIILSLSLFFGIVFAIGFHTVNEILGGTFNGNFVFNGNISHNGTYIPEGFSETNGVVHTTLMQVTASHGTATSICTNLNSKICEQREYLEAQLGWFDDSDSLAEDHLFWNGNTAWNIAIGGSSGSCSRGATVEAGWHTGNSYVLVDITTEADRCTRTLPYYCCKY